MKLSVRRLLVVAINLMGSACFVIGLVEPRAPHTWPWLAIIGFGLILISLTAVFTRALRHRRAKT